jgi:hypothetical protein
LLKNCQALDPLFIAFTFQLQLDIEVKTSLL